MKDDKEIPYGLGHTGIVEEDLRCVLSEALPWERFHNASVLITGGTGMLMSFLAQVLLYYRRNMPECGLELFVLARNTEAARKKYAAYWSEPYFHFIQADVCDELSTGMSFDYIVHGASPADPRCFGANPSDVFLPNVLGMYRILKATEHGETKGVLFLSSGEVYGRMPASVRMISESDYGFVDPLAPRSCYAEGKRAGEALCRIWAEQFQIPTKIVRISHTFGPTMDLKRDSRSFAEFCRCVVERRNIQMKSSGSAVRPFCYISDCTIGLLRVLLLGETGHAYNLAGDEYYSILELAELLCSLFSERKIHVVKSVRDADDTYLEAEKQPAVYVDTSRLKSLGWSPKVSVAEGFRRTIESFEAEKNG